MNGIEIQNLSKSYNKVQALDNITVKLEPQRIYGLLGRNGAGKSTLLNILTNRIYADSGEVSVDGHGQINKDEVLKRMFLMSETTLYPEGMRIEKAFKWAKEFDEKFDIAYAEHLAKQFSLDTKKKVKALSTGYLSVFKLIMALSYDRPYIFLDEPVLGLDANHRELFYKILLESYANNPRTIVISTHLIEEVSHLIEEVIIIKDGKILCTENCETLLQKGYSISGKRDEVDAYCADKEVIGFDTLGAMKIAYVLGQPDQTQIPKTTEISKLDLQKLFIQMTN